MTFCPETGDPAVIKPRLYTDAGLFAARTGQGFLIDDGRIVANRGADDDRPDPVAADLVQQLLDTETGNPLATTTPPAS